MEGRNYGAEVGHPGRGVFISLPIREPSIQLEEREKEKTALVGVLKDTRHSLYKERREIDRSSHDERRGGRGLANIFQPVLEVVPKDFLEARDSSMHFEKGRKNQIAPIRRRERGKQEEFLPRKIQEQMIGFTGYHQCPFLPRGREGGGE